VAAEQDRRPAAGSDRNRGPDPRRRGQSARQVVGCGAWPVRHRLRRLAQGPGPWLHRRDRAGVAGPVPCLRRTTPTRSATSYPTPSRSWMPSTSSSSAPRSSRKSAAASSRRPSTGAVSRRTRCTGSAGYSVAAANI
jgi:hypothetical protein